jgi:hypothetical protein
MRLTRSVPAAKFSQFHEILCATGGRYVKNPLRYGTIVEVCFEPGDYDELQRRWDRVTIDVREVRKDQWWRKILRRCGVSA